MKTARGSLLRPFLPLVGMAGFEPAVFCSQSRRDDQASLHPGLTKYRKRERGWQGRLPQGKSLGGRRVLGPERADRLYRQGCRNAGPGETSHRNGRQWTRSAWIDSINGRMEAERTWGGKRPAVPPPCPLISPRSGRGGKGKSLENLSASGASGRSSTLRLAS